MAESALAARSPIADRLRGIVAPAVAGVTVQEQAVGGAASLAARRDAMPALREAAEALGVALPEPRRWSEGGGWRAVWLGPERWLVFGAGDAERQLRAHFGPLASISDQSDSRVVLRLSGPRVRDILAKGLSIDLHPRAFAPGQAAVSQIGHVGVAIWQLDDASTYDLAVARSYAGSLLDWLAEAAAEHGLSVA